MAADIRSERDEFWSRFYADIERFRERGADCEIAVNRFEVRQWDVRFTRRRVTERPASVTLTISEHAPSKAQFLLAVHSVNDVPAGGIPLPFVCGERKWPAATRPTRSSWCPNRYVMP